MKKIMILAMIMSILLTGCSGSTLDADSPVYLNIWHVYGSQTESPLNELISEFNSTVGEEMGVIVNVESVTDSSKIDSLLSASLNNDPDALPLPDLFTAYPRVAEMFADGQLLNWAEYFSSEELEIYRDDFLSEGYFGDELLMIPIAKSSELMFVNKTLFDRFAAENNVTYDCFNDINHLMEVCNLYYDWSDGQTLFQFNELYHYFIANMNGLDTDLIVDGKVNAENTEFEKVFEPIAKAGIYGGLCVGDGFASDRWSTGEIIGNIGSTASIMYLRDQITYSDNTTEEIETLVLPYPCIKDAAPTIVQRGCSLYAVKSDNEKKNEAAAVFAKWIAETQHNLDFVTAAGYLPVTDEAFDALFSNLDSVENVKYRMLYSALSEQYDNPHAFCVLPLFEGASETQKNFEKLIKSVLSDAHEEYVQRTSAGDDPDTVMPALTEASLAQIRAALK